MTTPGNTTPRYWKRQVSKNLLTPFPTGFRWAVVPEPQGFIQPKTNPSAGLPLGNKSPNLALALLWDRYVRWDLRSMLFIEVVPMPDHDQRFKTLIKAFFADFLQLFFADYANRLELDSIQWPNTEMSPYPPEGSRHNLDLVAKLKIRQDSGAVPQLDSSGNPATECYAVVHLEIESGESKTSIMARMPAYYIHLRASTGLPVLPIIIFLNMVGDGHETLEHRESIFGLEIQVLRFLYVALKGLNALEYMEKDNLLGVALASLMKVPKEKIAWLGAESLRRISLAPINTQQQFLLGECVRAYLPMEPQNKAEYDKLLATETYKGVKAMNKTIYEEGIETGRKEGWEAGREKGIEQELLDLATNVLEGRFGPLTAKILADLKSRSRQELRSMITNSYRLTSLDDLNFADLK